MSFRFVFPVCDWW